MTSTTDVMTFSLNNPGRERTERQPAYLTGRPEQVFVLTETADSAGCALLAEVFGEVGTASRSPGQRPVVNAA
ncbi:hypothetical protein ABZX40_07045 [Streptomyces sp. NPDC004610]|uniref:hypothetical protein n=1 Tax=unclassified Streptomyces TaxID=2593676 RepID=UPI0033B0ED71